MTNIDYTPFTARTGVAALGIWMREQGIWDMVEQYVAIRQKTVKHTPEEKLLDALINILSGGERVVEVNTRVRSDEGLQRAFGRKRCADQSGVSRTLDCCKEDNVDQLRTAMVEIYRAQSQGYRHDYKEYQVLDVDMTGLLAGRQAEGATKGYFSRQKGRRGRQLGRVTATLYDEVVYQKLYDGKVQLDQCLQELVTAASDVLELERDGRRAHTVVRVDGGGGRDTDINWLLDEGYVLLAKAHNWQRCHKKADTVDTWLFDLKEAGREAGWVTEPHPYNDSTRQVVVRKAKANGEWQLSLLITNLPATTLFELAGLPVCEHPTPEELLWAFVYAYDKRSGGIETSFRQSKLGLRIHKRNKRRFAAQAMLVLLAELAQNLLVWFRRRLARWISKWRDFGIKRFLRDVLTIPGRIILDSNATVRGCVFDERQPSAAHLAKAALGLFSNDLTLSLRKI